LKIQIHNETFINMFVILIFRGGLNGNSKKASSKKTSSKKKISFD